jgi:selenide, water dikinase
MVDSAGIGDVMLDILFDPQTSGGLFMSVNADKASLLLAKLKEAGVTDAAIVGEVVSHPEQRIVVE